MTQFSIPVIEYQSPRPGHALNPPPPQFVVNDRQLIVAMVRSVLTVNSGRASRHYMAAIVKPTMEFLLDWAAAPDLRVSDYFLHVLRDFSATTRIGELAQGVTYAYWKWQRGYSWITDFGPWAAGLNPPYTGKKSPDFVMLNMATNDLAVMESKGTSSWNHKQAMGLALRQCRDAVKHKAFSRGYGSVLTLDTKNHFGKGTLHIRDPERVEELSPELAHYIFRRSYATWFDLVGDEEMAEWCRQEIGLVRPISRQRVAEVVGGTSSPLSALTAVALGFDPERTRFQIDPVIVEAIADFDIFKRMNQQLRRRVSDASSSNDRLHTIRFPDGTLITED